MRLTGKILVAGLLCWPAFAEQPKPVVQQAERSAVSPPLWTTEGLSLKPHKRFSEPGLRPLKKKVRPLKPGTGFDAQVQSFTIEAMPAPGLTFDGVSNDDNVAVNGGGASPPDPNGDVGPNHYVQMVNQLIQVFDKFGTPLTTDPLSLNALYAGFGGLCENGIVSDPIVLYDPLADRWLMSFVAFDVDLFLGTPVPPFHECVACSQSGDPAGAYYLYDFQMPNNWINDYPKFGVWPDAYYMTDNQFDSATEDAHGAGVFAFDRARILAGDPAASFIFFDLEPLDPNIDGLLPADLDGPPPPVGTPNYMLCLTADEFAGDTNDALRVFQFHADFANPGNSTFTERPESPIATAAFNPIMPCGATERDCVPQPAPAATNSRLDALSDRLMHRLQYRNFGTNESLVVNHTVNVGGAQMGNSHAAIRYYQLRRNGGAFTINEQTSFAPDGAHRWMGSAAMDRNGDLAVGYNVSNTNVFPSIRYAGRLVSDPANGLFQGETNLIAGTGSQTDTASRWGDYSMLAVDPADDCTFWLVAEYYSASSVDSWQTRIGTFKFAGCALAPKGVLKGTVTDASSGLPISNATVRTANGFLRTTSGTGTYSMQLPVDTYQVTASATGHASKTVSGTVITDGATNTQNFALSPAPIMTFVSSTFSDAAGNNNGGIDPNECISLNIILQNTGLITASNLVGTLSTTAAGIAITQPISTYPNTAVGVSRTNTTPFQISVGPTFPCGAPIPLTLTVTHNGGTNTIPVTLSTGSNVGAATRFDDNSSTPITFLVGGQSSLNVTGISNSIAKVTVSLHILFPEDGDLDIALVGPDNTAVALTSANGGSSSDYGTACSPDGSRTTFDDATSTTIGAGSPPYVGTFRPDEMLSAFNGKSGGAVNGTWTLVVANGFINEGSLECWSLLISQSSCTTGPGGCAGADTDADGLPDTWEQQYFGNLNQTATGDFDGDGLANLAEFQTGTVPTNSASAFRITDIHRESNNLRVTWQTATGKTNALERSLALTNSYSAIFIATNTPPGTTNYLDLGAATNAPTRYYRIRLVP